MLQKLKPDRNDKLFTWSEHLAYLIGLIVTDGYVNINHKHHINCVKVYLKESDSYVLEQLGLFLDITSRILKYFPDVSSVVAGKLVKRKERIAQLRISGAKFIDHIAFIGVSCKNKTDTQGALNIPPEYFCHFLRGVIDGDGSFTVTTNSNSKRYLCLLIYGNQDFLKYMSATIEKEVGLYAANVIKIPHTDRCWQIKYEGYRAATIRDYIYGTATIFLKRKMFYSHKFATPRERLRNGHWRNWDHVRNEMIRIKEEIGDWPSKSALDKSYSNVMNGIKRYHGGLRMTMDRLFNELNPMDPRLGIPWPISSPILSERDRGASWIT